MNHYGIKGAASIHSTWSTW